jgi:Holliday junction resolvase RusA-like endonuclease
MTVRAATRKPWNLANVEPLRRAASAVVLKLPAPPSANSLFANRRSGSKGRGRIKTEIYRAWIEEAGKTLMIQRPERVAGKYELSLFFERQTGRNDLDNRIKALADLLVTHGVIDDDSLAEKIVLKWSDEVEGVLVMIKQYSPYG